MKHCFLTYTLCTLSLFAAEPAKESSAVVPQHDMGKISKAFGHLIGQHLETLGLEFDMSEVVQGIKDRLGGKEPPMTEADCLQALGQIQEKNFQVQCETNLKQAEEFLSKNKKEPGVIELEPGKLQYVLLNEGKGALVEENFSPVIRYCGKFIDGKIFGQSQEDDVLSLNDTIEGFKKSIVGMKEGEKRRIFIHPELGYGQAAGFLPPNSLLTFEIEIIKANAPKEETKDSAPHTDEATNVVPDASATK